MSVIGALRGAAAAVFGFLAIAVAAPAASHAASYTLNFNGTVTSATGTFSTDGFTVGDAVSGSITFDPFNDSSHFTGGNPFGDQTGFSQSASSFTFHVAHPGGPNYSASDGFDGIIASGHNTVGANLDYLDMNAQGMTTALGLSFLTDAGNPPLTSLAGLPTSPDELVALLGGSVLSATGAYFLSGLGNVGFNITLSQTPIPGTLLLFASGLGGLGLFVRRGRKAAAGSTLA